MTEWVDGDCAARAINVQSYETDLLRFLRRCRKRGFKTVPSGESAPTSEREARRIRDLIFPPDRGGL